MNRSTNDEANYADIGCGLIVMSVFFTVPIACLLILVFFTRLAFGWW